MAEFKFSCPECGQSIQCDECWSGQQLPCPACHTAMIVPGLVPIEPAAAPVSAAPRPQAHSKAPRGAKPSRYSAKKIAAIAGGVVAFGVIYYFGLGWADAFQKHFNENQKKEAPNAVAGEMGHIANLYSVLDKTEPENMSRGMVDRSFKHHGRAAAGTEPEVFVPTPNPAEKLSVIPAEWTMDPAAAQIPEGKANGAISGSNFVVQSASLQTSGGTVTLNLQQGDKPGDPAIFVYLTAKAGEQVTGRTWNISKETKAPGTPQVVKRWQPNPRLLPVRKPFNSGYAMQLELGTPTNGWIPGKIFLALPDTEKTFVAGRFYIEAARDE